MTSIQAGDYVDIRDSDGDWFEARILSIKGKIARCHFINYSSKWDTFIQLTPHNIARKNSHSISTGVVVEIIMI